MTAVHNHPPRCCCHTIDLGKLTPPLQTDACPVCPEHGDLVPGIDCPQCHQAAGRPHTDYCTLAPGKVWDGVLPRTCTCAGLLGRTIPGPQHTAGCPMRIVADRPACSSPRTNHGDGRGCQDDTCPRHSEPDTTGTWLGHQAQLRTPTEWAKLEDCLILDADGWRSPHAKDFNEPITQAEYELRRASSTCSFPASYDQARIDELAAKRAAEDQHTCRPVMVDGEPVRLIASADLSPEAADAIAAVVRAARDRMDAEGIGQVSQPATRTSQPNTHARGENGPEIVAPNPGGVVDLAASLRNAIDAARQHRVRAHERDHEVEDGKGVTWHQTGPDDAHERFRCHPTTCGWDPTLTRTVWHHTHPDGQDYTHLMSESCDRGTPLATPTPGYCQDVACPGKANCTDPDCPR